MHTHDIGDTVDVDLDLLSGARKRRRSGTVTEVHADGQITAEFPQEGFPPMVMSGPADHFIPVRTECNDDLRQWLQDLADELAQDSSGDWGEQRDPIGVGWERACKHYAETIRRRLTELESLASRPKETPGGEDRG